MENVDIKSCMETLRMKKYSCPKKRDDSIMFISKGAKDKISQ